MEPKVYTGAYQDSGLKAGDTIQWVHSDKVGAFLYPSGETTTLSASVLSGNLIDEGRRNGIDATYILLKRSSKSKGLGKWLRERNL